MNWDIFPLVAGSVVMLLGAGGLMWLCRLIKKLDRELEQQVRDTFENKYRSEFDEIWAEIEDIKKRCRK